MKKLIPFLFMLAISSSAFAKTVQFKADLYLDRCVQSTCASPIIGAHTIVKVDLNAQGNGTVKLTASSDGVNFTAFINVHNSTTEYYNFQIVSSSVDKSGAGYIETLGDFDVDSLDHVPFIDFNGSPLIQGDIKLNTIVSMGPIN